MHAPVIRRPRPKRSPTGRAGKGERRKSVQAAILRSRNKVVVDLFCGAGSLSKGAHDALVELGYEPQFIAVNHWDIATQTYAANHPGARVHCVTLDAAFPMELVPEGVVDLLLAGIECTFFSRARGGRPVNDQQRMSAWHVLRWATELRVKRMLLENVPEFMKWGPVDEATGKPIKEREGEYFNAWKCAIESIGGVMETRIVNCANHGDPTTRVRLLIIIKFDGTPITWPAPSHAKRSDLAAPAIVPPIKPWRAMRECIDWSVKGKSIFDRPRPLAAKTLLRVWTGIIKFEWPLPFLVVLKAHADARGIDLPIPTIHAGGQHFGLVQPAGEDRGNAIEQLAFMLKQHFRRDHVSLNDPGPTVTTISRIGLVEPFILSQGAGGAPRATDQPMPAAPCGGAHALIAPYYSSGSGETCRSSNDPLPAATTKARFGIVMPVTHNDGSNRARSVDDQFPTLTTAKRGELAFITPGFGERPEQAPRTHSLDQPSPAICAGGHLHLAEGLAGAPRKHDILFRMLLTHELAAAMSIIGPGRDYKFIGNKTQVIRQIGQAVPYETAKAHVREVMAA